MFSAVRNSLGLIKVIQQQDNIVVEGVPGYFISNDISRIWKTSKISNYMFTKITRNSFTIPNFFALDLIYTLEAIISSKRKLGTSKHTAQKLIDVLFKDSWLATIRQNHQDKLDFKKLSLFWKTPLDFQTEFFNKYNTVVTKYGLNGYLLAGTAGSGKTYTSLAISEMCGSDITIVICQANSVNLVWTKSLNGEFKNAPSYWVSSSGLKYNGEKYVIFHYEDLYKAVDFVKNLNKKFCIILDESHNFNEINTLRSKLFIKLCDESKSKDIIFCSGTPFKAMGSESIVLFRCIDPWFTDNLIEPYKKLYGKNATKALDLLSARLDLVTHKIEKSQLGLLPPIIEEVKIAAEGGSKFTLENIKKDMISFIEERTTYYSKNSSKYSDIFYNTLDFYKKTIRSIAEEREFETYKRFVKLLPQSIKSREFSELAAFCTKFEKTYILPSLPKEWKEPFEEAKSVVKYVQLKIQGECLGRILGKRRMECTKLISDNADYDLFIESTSKKTLIFTSYVEVLENCLEILKNKGYNSVAVYGKTNSKLNEIISNYESNKDINPLVATFNSLSTAVPLTMADVMVMLNSPFRDYVLQQTISRISRLGSDTQTYVYICVLDTGSEPNMSTRTIDILKWSQNQVKLIMGIESPFKIVDDSDSIAMESFDQNDTFTISYSELMEKEKIL
jgi:hypothetical protein